MTYKAKIRIPKDQYAFIELDVEGSLAEIEAVYHGMLASGGELSREEWNRILDDYLNDKGMPSDAHEKMSPNQKWMIHELDKAGSRINYQSNKQTHAN